MNESERQKLERRYRRYYEATEGIKLQERTFVRFLAWLETKTDLRIVKGLHESSAPASPAPEAPKP